MKFDKKQKIIIGIIVITIVIAIYYYIDIKENNLVIEQQELIEIEESVEENTIKNLTKEEEIKKEIIKVHVSGAVNEEGVVELNVNDRISDAIQKAGGLKENACLEQINLAYKLEDGMKVYIPTKEEQKKNNMEDTIEKNIYITKTNENNQKSNEFESKSEMKVNINTATQTELETLPGIGPSIALKIINYRNENGKFTKIEDLKDVSGIGESKYNQIKNLINV